LEIIKYMKANCLLFKQCFVQSKKIVLWKLKLAVNLSAMYFLLAGLNGLLGVRCSLFAVFVHE
jgi:hypothetical protein